MLCSHLSSWSAFSSRHIIRLIPKRSFSGPDLGASAAFTRPQTNHTDRGHSPRSSLKKKGVKVPRVCVEWFIFGDTDGLNVLLRTFRNDGERLQDQWKLGGNIELQLIILLVTPRKSRLAAPQTGCNGATFANSCQQSSHIMCLKWSKLAPGGEPWTSAPWAPRAHLQTKRQAASAVHIFLGALLQREPQIVSSVEY